MATVRRLWKAMGRQRIRLIIVAVSVVFYTVLSVAAPVYSAGIVDLLWKEIRSAITDGTAFRVTWEHGGREIMILLGIYTATGILYTFQSFVMASFAERLSLELRTQISRKLDRLPLSFFDSHKPGEVLSRATNDLDKMSEVLQTGLLKLLTAVGMVVGSLIMMLRFHIGLTVVFLLFTLLSMFSTKLFAAKTLRYATLRQQAVSRVTGQVEESYSGRTVIRSFNREAKSAQEMRDAVKELADTSRKADFMMNVVNPFIRLVNRLGQAVIAVFAGKLLLDGVMTVGTFQAFFQYVYQASEPLTEAAYMINSLQSSIASVERIFELLDEKEIVPDPESPAVLQDGAKAAEGRVEFADVRFGYTPDKILMKGISFTAEPGQKIAIVGSTGAGKTTLINLLMRFYEVNGGRIMLDGIPTDRMTYEGLRSNFGMVLQDTWLFEGTIAENIAYGRPDASREEIIAAAKAARADFFIRTLPKGYDTVLGGDADNISAGQRQLLTIARVMLCDPAVLILDEATSSVDTRTEMEIGKAMSELMKNRTSFVIAHRLSTIVDADLILVMQNGDIIEKGNHRELLRAKGAYAELYNSQFA
ncbi:MAG TPA: ABC transporter ATP-binding protein/permease [Candidatus Mediterraneibacter faecigallinarum]|uniref:ABC transporter ATP-binding protein/permease n=1 Tax=Candidatus Mediterraneibacter faecigallinarum TaxID=2838669 RepID=A0A9D2NYI5_9FIRM|nr:ABC transporter ATP-binding protein/permease [Candidatus Mediterraneibacter faecigallinarum]